MAPTNPTDSAIEADNGDVAVDTRVAAGPPKAQSMRQFKLSEK